MIMSVKHSRAIPALLTLHFFNFVYFHRATIKHRVDQSNKFKAYDDLSGRYTVRCNLADVVIRVSSYNDIEP